MQEASRFEATLIARQNGRTKPRKTRVVSEKRRIPYAGEIANLLLRGERIEDRKLFPPYISTSGEGEARRKESGEQQGKRVVPASSQRTTPPSSRSANHAVGRVSDESGGRESDRAPVYRGRTSRHHVHHSRTGRIDRDRDRVVNESVRMISSRVPWMLDRRSGWWCD